jgi:predicted SAM-dependent methyltransferase
MSEIICVNFGCGSNRIEGWRNHDSEVDVTKRLPYDDATVDAILAEHIAEHLTCGECLEFFDECYRILKPGGRIRICVPVLERIFDVHHARDLCKGHGHKNLFSEQTLAQILKCAHFHEIIRTARSDIDGHHKVIGADKDDRETLRMEGIK